MGEPIRVLQVFASLDRGGAEAMIMSLYRNINKDKVQFDFVVNDSNTEYEHEREIIRLGGRVFYIPRFSFFNYFSYRKAWENLIEEHPEWRVVHGHHTSPAFIYLTIAKQKGRFTIAHSHIAGTDRTLKSYTKRLMRFPLRYIADQLFACSDMAAKWMYGKNSQDVYLINNSIDSKIFSYDESVRENMRKKLSVEGKFVVGHIGRFKTQKNHIFLLEVFNEIVKTQKNAVLLLIGDGELKSLIKKKAKSMGLEKKVMLLGVRSDIPELLFSMDVFLFPSLYEGLPVTLIEAQASGLKCIVSDTITSEMGITKLVKFISLSASIEYWAKQTTKYFVGYERKNMHKEIIEAGYDVKSNAVWLRDYYEKMSLLSPKRG